MAAEFSHDYDSNKVAFYSYYYPDLLEKNNISKEMFENSYKYYSDDISRFQIIYNRVEERLTQKRETLELLHKQNND